jgi:hypothetical protein
MRRTIAAKAKKTRERQEKRHKTSARVLLPLSLARSPRENVAYVQGGQRQRA